MKVYHGTTWQRARRICQEGFMPRRPSRRVWFAQSRRYAEGRGRTQARRTRDRSVVLTCELDLTMLRKKLGARRVMYQHGIVAIEGAIPLSALRSIPNGLHEVERLDGPVSADWLADWLNGLLELKKYNGISARHQGIQRLTLWVSNRLSQQPGTRVTLQDVLKQAHRWLPEYLDGTKVAVTSKRPGRHVQTIDVELDYQEVATDPRQDKAMDLLMSEQAGRRIRGLKLLRQLEDPDLPDWCEMLLDDPDEEVQVTALRLIARDCDDADTGRLLVLSESPSDQLRAIAIACLCRHDEDSGSWYRVGLSDPSASVRMETVSMLKHLDPIQNCELFELALYDPNSRVQQQAERLTAHKGYKKLNW